MSFVIVSKKTPWIPVSRPFDDETRAKGVIASVLKDPNETHFEVLPEGQVPSPPQPKGPPEEVLQSWDIIDDKGKVLRTFQSGKTQAGILQRRLRQFDSKQKIALSPTKAPTSKKKAARN